MEVFCNFSYKCNRVCVHKNSHKESITCSNNCHFINNVTCISIREDRLNKLKKIYESIESVKEV